MAPGHPRALAVLCDVVVERVAAHGEVGARTGNLYSALGAGYTVGQFEGVLRALVATSRLVERGGSYFVRERRPT